MEPVSDSELGRWFKMYASITDHPVFSDAQAYRAFGWCMRRACWRATYSHGKQIPRGSFWTTNRDGAVECHSSIETWRKAMAKLVELEMIKIESTSTHTFVTIVNYDKYQGDEPVDGVLKNSTPSRTRTSTPSSTPTGTPTSTRSRSTSTGSNQEVSGAAADAAPPATRQRFVPPTIQEAAEYARQVVPFAFSVAKWHEYYTSNGWKVGRNPMKDWKAALRRWAREDRERNARPGDRPSTMPSVIPGMERHLPTNQRRLIGE